MDDGVSLAAEGGGLKSRHSPLCTSQDISTDFYTRKLTSNRYIFDFATFLCELLLRVAYEP